MRSRNLRSLLVIAGCSGGSTQTPKAPTGSAAAVAPAKTPPSAGSAAPVTPPPAPIPVATPSGGSVGTAPLATVPTVKVTLADVGLEASSLDRTADPCVDFYQYACGGWLQNNPIPSDRARWSRFSEVDDKNKAGEKAILEEAAKGIGADASTKKLGDFYASCMDESAIDKAGGGALKPLLDKTQQVRDAKGWLTALTELHKLGAWVLWSVQVAPDLKEAANAIDYLDVAGLGLPDRDYYLKPDYKDKLGEYKLHVAKSLSLTLPKDTPAAKSDAAAADVVAVETELAKLMKSAAERGDVAAIYNPTDAKALAKQVKSVDWKVYWKALDVAPSTKLVLGTPKFFAQLDALRAKFRWAQWANYFTYHLVHAVAFALPRPYDDEAFELQRSLTGIEKQRERSKRCIDATQDALGELLGQQFVAKHFAGGSKQTAVTLVDALLKATADQLGRVDWLADPTKQIAQQKLGKIVRLVGYPDRWKTYEFDVRRDDFLGNTLRAAAFAMRRDLGRAGKPVERADWTMSSYRVDAYYNATTNNAHLPAGILQPPFFGHERSIAANLGAIGMLIGHELTHAIDDRGAQFDGDGNLKEWWQKDDKSKFGDRAMCLVDQYSGFEALPKQFVQGKLTVAENVADLGGVKMAFNAYRSLRRDASKVYIADGLTEDQQFFVAVAQAWCSKDRTTETQLRLTTDPHAPPKFRVYGALRNLREFSDAFKCVAGTPMHPAKTCTVW